MRREDVIDLLKRFAPTDQSKIVFVLQGGRGILTDVVFKTEAEYVVVRGRETGTNDENRGFFVPYGEIAYLRLERSVKLSDLKRLYGMPVDEGDDHEGGADEAEVAEVADPVKASAPQDPAAIAKQNLLDRIRAARTAAGPKAPAAK